MRGRHLLLTGASGLLGSRVLRLLLSKDVSVTALARKPDSLPKIPGLRIVYADLSSDFFPDLENIGTVDGVLHLAQAGGWSEFPVNAGKIAAVAVASTSRLAEYAVAQGAKTFVLASSGGIYGPSPVPIPETAPIRPATELGFYLSAKAAAETLSDFFTPYMTVHKLRYFFMYGKGQRDEFLIARMLRSVRDGTPIRLAQGTGPRLNPVYVEDAANATVAALDCTSPVTANIAGPDVSNLATIVDNLGRLVGRTPVCEPTTDLPQDYVADTSVMSHQLWVARIGLAIGLSRMTSSEHQL
jgi:nucleoside-diphosphate-sugar epimerase